LTGKESLKTFYFHFEEEEKFLIEIFGHSHYWHISDWSQIEDINEVKKQKS